MVWLNLLLDYIYSSILSEKVASKYNIHNNGYYKKKLKRKNQRDKIMLYNFCTIKK